MKQRRALPKNDPGLTRAKREIKAVNDALRAGHHPTGLSGNWTQKSAIRIAAERCGVDRMSLLPRVGKPDAIGTHEKRYGLKPDWALYKPDVPAELPPAKPADPVDQRRHKDENVRLRAALAATERRAADAEDIRSGVLGLVEEPLKPRLVVPKDSDVRDGGRTVILHLSDVHYGETVSFDEMDGTNKYDAAIAHARLGRFFDKAAALMTKHWSGTPPDEIVLCLGGDLVSGLIHDELLQTNAPAVPATVREVGEFIAGGIVELHRRVKCPIRVYTVPGNHGRLSAKPQSKGRAANSLDLLATDFAEATLRGTGIKGVTFYRTSSPDAFFSVYGWHLLLTHGDTMGGRGGGTGFIGPMASIIKGHRKLVDTSWRSGRPVHYVLTAHYHTTGKTAFGWANGSVIGYGEYARDLRADPEPARQNMLVIHPRLGVITEQPLYLGVPSEGSHYAGPASVIRPAWGDAD